MCIRDRVNRGVDFYAVAVGKQLTVLQNGESGLEKVLDVYKRQDSAVRPFFLALYRRSVAKKSLYRYDESEVTPMDLSLIHICIITVK